jgi:hypothetical protein
VPADQPKFVAPSHRETETIANMKASQQIGLEAYRAETGKQDASLEEMLASPEGLLHWCTKGLDTSARGPLGQQFARALNSNSQACQIYKTFGQKMQKEFRLQWMVQKDWTFLKDTKRTTQAKTKPEM